MTRVRVRSLLAVLAVGVLVLPQFADAHPKGQRPVLLIEPRAEGFIVEWVVAADDISALGTQLGLGVRRPTTYAEAPAFVAYIRERLIVAPVDGERCATTVTRVDEVATGFSVGADVDCAGTVPTVTITTRLLLDLSTDYVTMLDARTEAGSYRAAFTAAQPTLRVPFVGEAALPEPPAPDSRGRLEALIRGEGQLGLVVAFGLALLLGMVHGLTPGHGKTLAAAYLAGSRGTMRQALELAGIVSIAHGASTMALAGLAASVDQFLPERIVPWLEGVTALLALGVGIALLRGRAVGHRHDDGHHHDDDHHTDADGRAHADGSTHPAPAATLTRRRLVAIGLIGGLIPGPEAFAVGFLAVALDRLALGIALIGAFSLGLGLIVFAVAAIAVAAGKVVEGSGRLALLAPRVAGVVFIGVAIFLGLRALG